MPSLSLVFLHRKSIIGALVGVMMLPAVTFAAPPSPSLDDHPVKVKLGEVTKVSDLFDTFTLKLASSTVSVHYTASTTVFLGTGEETSIDQVEKGQKIYVFGTMDDAGQEFNVEKIVIKNASKLSRVKVNPPLTIDEGMEKLSSVTSLWMQVWKGVTFTTAYGAETLQTGIGYLESSSTGRIFGPDEQASSTQSENIVKKVENFTNPTGTSTIQKKELSVRSKLII